MVLWCSNVPRRGDRRFESYTGQENISINLKRRLNAPSPASPSKMFIDSWVHFGVFKYGLFPYTFSQQ